MEQEGHQYQMEPQSVNGLVHTVAFLCCLMGNASVVIIICRTPQLHTPTCVFMLAFAVVDVLLAMVWNVTPLILMNHTLRENFPASWACTAVGFLWQSVMTMSSLLQAVIAFDRYFFIVHPYKYLTHMTNKRAGLCCVLILLISGALPAAVLLNGNSYRFIPAAMTCSGPTLWPVLFFSLIFLPSISLAIFSSQRVWKLCTDALKQIRHRQESQRSQFSLNCHAESDMKVYLLDEAIKTMSKREISTGQVVTPEIGTSTDTSLSESSFPRAEQIQVNTWSGVSGDLKAKTNTTTTSLADSQIEGLKKETEKSYGCLHMPGQIQRNPVSILMVEEIQNRIENVYSPKSTLHGPGIIPEISLSTGLNGSLLEPKSRSTSIMMSQNNVPEKEHNLDVTLPENQGIILTTPKSMLPTDVLDHANCMTPPSKKPTVADLGTNDQVHYTATLRLIAACNPVISWVLVQEKAMGTILRVDATSFYGRSMVKQHAGYAALSYEQIRRVRAYFMVGLPVLGVVFSCLPLLIALIVWDYGSQSEAYFMGVRIVCHISYSMIPSAVSLLLLLTNKPCRHVLRNQISCCRRRKISPKSWLDYRLSQY